MSKGRNCSLDYILDKNWVENIYNIEGFTALYIVGGLYGNKFSLEKIKNMAQQENAKIIFNGDIHWFDVHKEDFLEIENIISGDLKLLGNVEYELISKSNDLGCGCNYPENVDKGIVERSNIIHNLIKENIKNNFVLEKIKEREKTCVVTIFGKKIAISHGDEKNMAGWECGIDKLRLKERQEEIACWLENQKVDILATAHTCLPVVFKSENGIVINNGAAGMANIKNKTYGLITRIAKNSSQNSILSVKYDNIYVELVKVEFSIDEFLNWFDNVWSESSPASISYRERIAKGTNLEIENILIKR